MLPSTPEPHLVPGYDGHCSQYKNYVGGTYAQLTHKALLSPCVPHGKDINLTVIHKIQEIELPTKEEKRVLGERQKFVDAVFHDPIIPGYAGCVPRLRSQVGKRYLAAATSALVEHEELMELKRCEHRNLLHGNMLQISQGRFEPKMNERLISRTKYRAPLIPVRPRCQAVKTFPTCVPVQETIQYSKFTTPHFKNDDDKDKWIISGYCGHIPNARFMFGSASKSLTRAALNQFSDGVKQRRYEKWCRPNYADCIEEGCPGPDCEIYRSENSVIPRYAGHVPGRIFQIGKRSAIEMRDAKLWLRQQKLLSMKIAPPACGEQCR